MKLHKGAQSFSICTSEIVRTERRVVVALTSGELMQLLGVTSEDIPENAALEIEQENRLIRFTWVYDSREER